MTSRTLAVVDRLAALILGLALIAAGAALIWWHTGNSRFPARTDTGQLRDLVDRSWWPWASAIVGVVAILIGLRWLAGHLVVRRAPKIVLPGSDTSGVLTLQLSQAARAAADEFAETTGVRSAKGVALTDRRQLVARISAVIEPEADLDLLAARADAVAGDLGHVVGRADLRCTVQLRVASRGRALT